ncbi:lysoplasmalogenase [Ciceribacter sp. L1K22]|uniref:lysoplasmalogenase n=1 Tax=Ciceribacter sp. L1K22 TaxID=2820275 RepID=UPI001ABDAEE8|nr:lysoplasmalogenase [Ciceribacter sp. L1K22]MBO3762407.1 lysoplasmalogenase [Ciceribacter sp. L1K22]
MGEGILLYAAIAFGILYLPLVERAASPVRTLLKTLPVLLLALFAWRSAGPILLTLALFLSALGDAFLAGPGERRFIAGLVSFLLAHMAYGGLFAILGVPTQIPDDAWRLVALAATVAAGGIILGFLWRPAGSLAPAVAFYCLAIFGMTALSLAIPSPLVFLAAVIFVSSDTTLAIRTFVLPRGHPLQKPFGIYVWVSYFLAQFTLTLALLDATF